MAVPIFILGELRETDLNLIHFEIHLLQKNYEGGDSMIIQFFIRKFKKNVCCKKKLGGGLLRA